MNKFFIYLSIVFVPLVVGAQNNLSGLLDTILGWINSLIPIAFALALLLFFWGLAKFMLEAGSTEGQTRGKNLMIWGVVAFFVMASLGGLIIFLQQSVGITDNSAINQPTFNFSEITVD